MAPRQRSTPSNSGSEESSSSASSKQESDPIVVSSSLGKRLPNQSHLSSSSSSSNSSTSHGSNQDKSTVTTSSSSDQQHEVIVADRDRHDIFNLIALPIMLGSMKPNFDVGVFWNGGTLEESWSDTYLYECLFVVTMYFILDLIWVAVVPTCVKSPGTIIKHHIVALIYLTGPYLMPDFRCYMIAILSVEVNTWFLIARRVFYLRRATISAAFRDFIDYAFYISWIVTRVLIHNWLLYRFCCLYYERIMNKQTILIPTMFVGTQAALNVMDLKWTYDLFMPMIQRKFMNDNESSSSKPNKQHTL